MEEIRKVLWNYYGNEEDVEKFEDRVVVYETDDLWELGELIAEMNGLFDGFEPNTPYELYFDYERYAKDITISNCAVCYDGWYYIWSEE